MIFCERFPFNAIAERSMPPLSDGMRVIAWTIVNPDCRDMARTMARHAFASWVQ